jgi:4-amino-4-deoxy-L-arabinose transferase-like glycosyltransferase
VALLAPITGDLFWSGKLVALAAGVLAVPATYLLWSRIESGRVGLLAAWLLAVNWVAWYHSAHAFRDTLFLFLSILSLYLLYRARDDLRFLPLLGLSLGLATMTREEGYILTVSAILALGYWKRDDLRREWSRREVLYASLFLLAFMGVIYPWHHYRSVETDSVFPMFSKHEVETWGHAGLGWIPSLLGSVSIPLSVLAALSHPRLVSHTVDERPIYHRDRPNRPCTNRMRHQPEMRQNLK